MDKELKALKNSSNVIAVIMKIGYIAMIVAMCICASSLIFLAVTGGKTSIETSGGTTIGITDASASPAEVVALSCEYFIMSGFLFAIFLLAQRIFGEIRMTGNPFLKKYAKRIRAIGILIAVMTFVVGIADTIVSHLADVKGIETYTEAPGVVFGAVIFCLSYIIDYGCALNENK